METVKEDSNARKSRFDCPNCLKSELQYGVSYLWNDLFSLGKLEVMEMCKRPLNTCQAVTIHVLILYVGGSTMRYFKNFIYFYDHENSITFFCNLK